MVVKCQRIADTGCQIIVDSFASRLTLYVLRMCCHFCHVWLFAVPWTVARQATIQSHWILQKRDLEWVATPSSRRSCWPRDRSHISLSFFFICSGFCHTLKWNSHGFTCVPHPDPPSHLPLHPLRLGFPSAPGPSACLMHPTWAGDLFHPR